MIISKFGGTAITPRNLNFLKKIITKDHKCVVVSAIGKTHPNDIKTTDLLQRYFVDKNEEFWQQICNRYKNLVDVNCIKVDVEQLLYDARKMVFQLDENYAMSLGEELSAKIVACYLNGQYIEADQMVHFVKNKIDFAKTTSCLKNAFDGANLGVIGGFYGGMGNSRQTFSRGGSDVTGSLCAYATNSTLYENWTDSNGVCQCNPSVVANVSTIPFLGYRQMYLLAKSGATVLHPDAVTPLERKSIPLKIANFFNPNAPCTTVSNNVNFQKLLCVTQKQQKDKFVVTVLHNMTFKQISGALTKLSKFTFCQVEIQPKVVRFVTHKDILQQIFAVFDDISQTS